MAQQLKKKKGQTPTQENYNDSQNSFSPNYVGQGITNQGFNYNSSWNGQFQLGGSLSGATGFMYARHGAPDNGKYAKKTKSSAQNGASMSYYQHGLDYLPKSMKKGGIIEDPKGQWAHPGSITKIPSNNITMANVSYPVLGISNTGHTQIMYPEQDYQFHGNSVTEYPVLESGGSIQDKGQLKKLDDLTNFTNYNVMKKAQYGERVIAPRQQFHFEKYQPIDTSAFVTPPSQKPVQQAAPTQQGGMDPSALINLATKIGPMLAKNGGSYKKGNLDLKKLNKVLAKNGYSIQKLPTGGAILGDDPQGSAWGNSSNTQTDTGIQTTDPNIQTYAPGSEADPNANIQYTTNNPNQFSVSTIPDSMSGWDKFSKGINDVDKALKPIGGLGGGLDAGMKIFNDINQIKQDKKNARKDHGVTRAVIAAMKSSPKQQNAQYFRPEQTPIQQGQLNVSQGVGTNYLAANGTKIPENPSEISNTFAPNNIYTDSGYEPLSDSDNIKKFQYGGGQQLGEDIGGTAGTIAGNILLPGIGGVIGGAAGKLLGKGVANLFGANKLNKQHAADQRDLSAASFGNQATGMYQGQFNAIAKDGTTIDGWMNPNYNPQIITKFDGHDVKSTFQHQLRSGGHISQEYVEPHESSYMETGGELQTHWGGKAEPISYNPYLPDGGETVMFKGASHKDGGIGVTYGSNPVEVQGGEPATKLAEGGNSNNLVVFGGMKISPLAAKEIGDENAIGKKYQTYATEISRNEAKASKTLNDATELINNHTSSDAFSQLAFSSGQAKMIGAQMQLKNAAQKKQLAGIVQNAILDTANEHGLVADKLAENKIVPMNKKEQKAKWGKAIAKAQQGASIMKYNEDGTLLISNDGGKTYIPSVLPIQQPPVQIIQPTQPISSSQTDNTQQPQNTSKPLSKEEYNTLISLRDKAEKTKNKKDVLAFQQEYHKALPDKALEFIQTDKKVTTKGQQKYHKQNVSDLNKDQLLDSNEDGIFGKRTKQYIATLDNLKPTETQQVEQKVAPVAPSHPQKDDVIPTAPQQNQKPGIDKYLPLLNPLFRHKYSPYLDPNQTMGEYYALAHNQLEPVKAQQYNPQLESPYDISYQDQLNANQADFNLGMRSAIASNNPAFTASLLANKYAANEKVLGEQFRQNQAEKANVYNKNIATLNDAQLKNLGILDQQYTRQEQAKSNTKAQAINALTSIGDKIAQSKRDANEMNMYSALNPNFYVDSNGVFHNQGFASLNTQGNGQMGGLQQILKDEEQAKVDRKAMKADEKSINVRPAAGLKYGGSINKKDQRNSNIVKAIKNSKLYK